MNKQFLGNAELLQGPWFKQLLYVEQACIPLIDQTRFECDPREELHSDAFFEPSVYSGMEIYFDWKNN